VSGGQSLTTTPLRGRIVPELRWHGITTYRELIVSSWRIIYRVDAPRVLVVSVVDSRRQLEDLLLARFLRA
jgi:toxin ParE1/3/4